MDIGSTKSTNAGVQRQLHSLEGFLRVRSDELGWDEISRVVSHAVNRAQLKAAMLHRSDPSLFESAVEHIKKDVDDLVDGKAPGSPLSPGRDVSSPVTGSDPDTDSEGPSTPEAAFEPIRKFASEVTGDDEQTQALMEVQNSWKEVEHYQMRTARKFDFDKAVSPRFSDGGSPFRETSPRFSRVTPTRRHVLRPSFGSSRSTSTENSPVCGEAGPFQAGAAPAPAALGSSAPASGSGFSFRKIPGFAN